MSDWRDMIVGARMAVDSEFSDQVEQSTFSRQEWGLIMTATTFEIENAEDPDSAHLVADTSELPAVMPELERIANLGPMGVPGEDGGSNGFLGRFFEMFGMGDSGQSDEERIAEAERLTAAYARELQDHLEETGRWDDVREAAAAHAAE